MNPPQRTPTVLGYLRAALGPGADGPADADLLTRFARERDEEAFELLVWRHAGMVLRACRSVLRDHHAAEDACQAAFLALARQAAAVGRRGTVAGWLYRVARRIAVRAARCRADHPSATPAGLDRLPGPDPAAGGGPDPDAVRLLFDELERLPEKYRAPVVLCFLDGLSYADAARRLGWPVGTVAGRVARAKEWLHDRLRRRGVAVPTIGLAAVLVAEPASAVAPAFVASTARAAGAFASGGDVSVISPAILVLARGGIRAMRTTKLQWVAGVLVACGVLALGGVWAADQKPPVPPPPPPAAKAADQPPADPVVPGKAVAGRRAGVAERTRSLNNLKGIMVGVYDYSDVLRVLPTDIRDKDGKPLLSWRVALLPFIDEEELYKQFKLDEPWDSEHNKKLLAKMPAWYRVGFEPKGATDTYYQVFAGPGTPFDPKNVERVPGFAAAGPGGYYRSRATLAAGLPDGASVTLAVVEAGPPVPWTKPADIPYDPKKLLPKLDGPFANELHAATMDAEAHALRRDIGEEVFRHLIESADGQPAPDLKALVAPLPAETPEEKEALKVLVERNRVLIEEIDRLGGPNIEALRAANRGICDVFVAEELGKKLADTADALRAAGKNKKPQDKPDTKKQRDKPVTREAAPGTAPDKTRQEAIKELLVGKWEDPERPVNGWEFDKEGRFGDIIADNDWVKQKVELHEIIVRVGDLDKVIAVADSVREALEKSHPAKDWEITAP
jgi:RNA polymerase sigma factor (sigma-70 family)